MSIQIFGQDQLSGHNYMDVLSDGSIKTQIADSNGYITSGNPFPVREYSFVDECNSSTAPLSGGGVFLGDPCEILQFGVLTVAVYSNVASATDGLEIQQSVDKTNWDFIDNFTIPAATGKTFSVQPTAKWLRIKYTNGAVAQTSFRLQVIKHSDYVKPSSHRIADSIISDDDAELVKAVITGENPAGNFVNFTSTTQGNFKVSIEEFENTVSDDSNAALKVSPYSHDEYGNSARLLSDNLFQGALITIPVEHHEIHCGDSYVCTHIEDVAGSASHLFLVEVPLLSGSYPSQDHKTFHAVFEGYHESEGEWNLYEAPTVSTSGNVLTVRNRNRESGNTDFLNVWEGAAVSDNGDFLEGMHTGAGKGVGGEGRTDEWILKNNTQYLVSFTNAVATANHITFRLNYYVHPGI